MSVRILVVDDHTIFRQGLRAALGGEPGLEVVGDVGDGYDALEAIAEQRPDAVLMDLSLPRMNGMEATRRICEMHPAVAVLCLSMHAEGVFVEGALDAGASGYLLKDCDLEELVRAVETVVAGQVYLSPGIAGTVLEGLRSSRAGAAPSSLLLLTAREREVLQLVAEGHATREIADRLGLSVKTIGSHREHVMTKLGISSVAGLTKYAIRQGLTAIDE